MILAGFCGFLLGLIVGFLVACYANARNEVLREIRGRK